MEEGIEIDFEVRELPALIGVGEPGIRADAVASWSGAGWWSATGDRLMVRDTARLARLPRSYLAMKWKFGDL